MPPDCCHSFVPFINLTKYINMKKGIMLLCTLTLLLLAGNMGAQELQKCTPLTPEQIEALAKSGICTPEQAKECLNPKPCGTQASVDAKTSECLPASSTDQKVCTPSCCSSYSPSTKNAVTTLVSLILPHRKEIFRKTE